MLVALIFLRVKSNFLLLNFCISLVNTNLMWSEFSDAFYPSKIQGIFKINQLCFGEYLDNFEVSNSSITAVQNCFKNANSKLAEVNINQLLKHNENMTLLELIDSYQTISLQYDIESEKESHILNTCSIIYTNSVKEVFYHLALIIYPKNVYVIKNLAMNLENYGKINQPLSLYQQCYYISLSLDCLLLGAVSSPLLPYDESQAKYFMMKIISSLYNITTTISNKNNLVVWYGTDPLYIMNNIPLNCQYLGYHPHLIFKLYSNALLKLYPQIDYISDCLSSSDRITTNSISKDIIIRVGIVSESHINTSPGICIERILERLSQMNITKFLNSQWTAISIDLVFFDRVDLVTVFGIVMRSISKDILILDINSLETSRSLITSANIDILIYLALPTDKFTYLLAHSRLAPIQIVFGLGHPLSSGIKNTIDYSILNFGMVPTLYHLTIRNDLIYENCEKTINECVNFIRSNNLCNNSFRCQNPFDYCNFPVECEGDNYLSFVYSEQYVLFDSLGYYLKDPIDVYGGDPYSYNTLTLFSTYRSPYISDHNTYNKNKFNNHMSSIDTSRYHIYNHNNENNENITIHYKTENINNKNLQCLDLEMKLESWGIKDFITARDIGCYNKVNMEGIDSFEFVPGIYNLYSCIQILKKFHPSFDYILLGILNKDVYAKIIVFVSVKSIIPRLLRHVNNTFSESELLSRFLFIPRLDPIDYLSLLALSSVFLNTFPFGAGITSSEAIAMCIPVIVMKKPSSILNFAFAQVNSLGIDLQKLLVVNDRDDYIKRAVDIANNKLISIHLLKDIICERKKTTLFNENKIVSEVSSEWFQFLSRVYLYQ